MNLIPREEPGGDLGQGWVVPDISVGRERGRKGAGRSPWEAAGCIQKVFGSVLSP